MKAVINTVLIITTCFTSMLRFSNVNVVLPDQMTSLSISDISDQNTSRFKAIEGKTKSNYHFDCDPQMLMTAKSCDPQMLIMGKSCDPDFLFTPDDK